MWKEPRSAPCTDAGEPLQPPKLLSSLSTTLTQSGLLQPRATMQEKPLLPAAAKVVPIANAGK